MPEMTNCEYNCLKLLYKLAAIDWFIENHGYPDAADEKKSDCTKLMEHLQKDLAKHISAFKKHVCK